MIISPHSKIMCFYSSFKQIHTGYIFIVTKSFDITRIDCIIIMLFSPATLFKLVVMNKTLSDFRTVYGKYTFLNGLWEIYIFSRMVLEETKREGI